MEEENVTNKEGDLGKFKSVDALKKAYEELEAEFTRRSQRLKALEESKAVSSPAQEGQEEAPSRHGEDGETAESGNEALFRAASRNGEVRARIIGDYLESLRGAPLLMGAGRGISAPADRPKSFAEAGALALGYLKSNS